MGIRTFLDLKRPTRRELYRNFRTVPWITDGAVRAIESFLIQERGGEADALECGSGASTVWTATRVKHLVSLEHDKQWASVVRRKLSEQKISVDYRLIKRPYFYEIETFGLGAFDYVLVDGRDRVECARRARRTVKPGGVLVLDNSERIGSQDSPGRYYEIPDLLKGWDRTDHVQEGPDQVGWIAPHPHVTSIWRRPPA